MSNTQRRLLIQLIYENGMTIRKAALMSKIGYPAAKAINQTYIEEKRIDKKTQRFRKLQIHTNN